MKLKPVLFFAAVALVAAFFVYRERSGVGTAGNIVVGSKAPDFAVTDEQGKTVRLSDFRGKLVFLNFWATWCAPCLQEMPEMDLMNRKFKDRDFQMLAVSVDTNWTDVKKFYDQNKIDVPTFLDPGRRAANLYRTFKFPETYIIDEKGYVRKKVVGAERWSNVRVLASIEELIPGSQSSAVIPSR